MSKLVLRRKGATLYAPSQDWADQMAELPEGVDLNVNATRARSLSQLGLYWGAVSFALHHAPETFDGMWADKDALSDFLQVEVGFVRHVAFPQEGGQPIYVRFPASKSFSECDQTRFNGFFEKAMTKLSERWGFDVLAAYLEHMRGRDAA